MSIFQAPVLRKQYAGINNPRFVTDLVVLAQDIQDMAIALTGLGPSDFAILSGMEYTGVSPTGSYGAGMFYLNGSIYYIGTSTAEGLYLIGTTTDVQPIGFQDSITRDIYTLQQGLSTSSPTDASPVLSGNMNNYRIGLSTMNANIITMMARLNLLGSASNLNASSTPVTGQVAIWGNLLTAAQIAANYLALAGGTLTGALTLAADPTASLQASTKQYADQAAGMKLLWVGVISANGAVITPQGPTGTPVVVSSVTKPGTGKYVVNHNIGNSNYFVVGAGLASTTPGSYVGGVSSKTNTSFQYLASDDGSLMDADFEIMIVQYF